MEIEIIKEIGRGVYPENFASVGTQVVDWQNLNGQYLGNHCMSVIIAVSVFLGGRLATT